MNFLEIVQFAAIEAGTFEPGEPSTVADQTGALKTLVHWCRESYKTIQVKRPYWDWKRATFTGSITAASASYSYTAFGITSWARWVKDSIRADGSTYRPLSIYKTSDGVSFEQPLPFMRWDEFRSIYLRGSVPASTPAAWTINPRTKEIVFGPAPNANFTVNGEHILGEEILVNDDDEPLMPVAMHPAIAWGAVKMLQEGDEATAQAIVSATEKYTDYMRHLDRDEYEETTFGGDPLA